jgi:catechol 2,3-dioxygenase-like lactoylglutathione lyase family enzyme
MADTISPLVNNARRSLSRRLQLAAVGAALVAIPGSAAMAQGGCLGRPAQHTPACDTTHLKAPFPSTGWKTVALDHFTMHAVDYKKEAAGYMALMNWKLRSDDGKQAVLDAGDIGTVIIIGGYTPPPPRVLSPADSQAFALARAGGAGGAGRGARTPRPPVQVSWDSFAWEIAPWDAKKIGAKLTELGLNPVADNSGPKGCESFHVKDPDGFDLQLTNGCYTKGRKGAKAITWPEPAPYANTNWKTVWLDHISFQVSNYKEEYQFYQNLIGWKPQGDEGSQNETWMCDDCGNILIRGGNPMSPTYNASAPRRASIDHVSFGVTPFVPDVMAAELKARGLNVQYDIGIPGMDATAHINDPDVNYKSFHTNTPENFNLQFSNATKANRTVILPKK